MKCFIAVLFVCLAILPTLSEASPPPIRLTLGESKIIQVDSPQKVAVENSAIADISVVSDHEILVSGKTAGSTDMVLISENGQKEVRTINVSIRNLKKSMVEVAVEIMELNTESALKAGLSWGSLSAPVSGGSPDIKANNVTVDENAAPPLLSFGSVTRQALSASIQLLISRGKARILAKPKLLAVSGEEASFLAGGEIPYILESKLGSPNVEWKPYGVKLQIKPAIDGDGNISAHLRAEVSGIDSQKGISLGSILVPAIRTRWAETTVYMRSGSTLVIAGLINEESQKFTAGIPVLSDIPILGELFKFTDNRQLQSELVIFVTPSLVGHTGD